MFGGRCAYCACELGEVWNVDHVIAHERRGTCDMENLVPACVSCNNYKTVFSVEQFRQNLALIVKRLNEHNSTYRIAKRFGLIKETGEPVRFLLDPTE